MHCIRHRRCGRTRTAIGSFPALAAQRTNFFRPQHWHRHRDLIFMKPHDNMNSHSVLYRWSSNSVVASTIVCESPYTTRSQYDTIQIDSNDSVKWNAHRDGTVRQKDFPIKFQMCFSSTGQMFEITEAYIHTYKQIFLFICMSMNIRLNDELIYRKVNDAISLQLVHYHLYSRYCL
jgi:hypothetical protein